MICGDATLWKSAPSTPLTAIATTKIIEEVLKRNKIPTEIASLVTGGAAVGKVMVNDKRCIFFFTAFLTEMNGTQ